MMRGMADLRGTPVEHLSYGPDLAPCDVCMVPTLKHGLQGKKLKQ
jgi:hypothetical protein